MTVLGTRDSRGLGSPWFDAHHHLEVPWAGPDPLGPQLAFLSATVVAPRLVLIAGGYDRSIVPTSRAVLVSIPQSRGG